MGSGCPRSAVANVLDWNIVEIQFKLQSCTPLPASYRLNSTPIILLQEWLWLLITHEGSYAIKTENKLNFYSNIDIIWNNFQLDPKKFAVRQQ